MISTLFTLLVAAVVAYCGLTQLLWFYEKRVHGPPSPRASLTPAVGAFTAETAALLLLLALWPFGVLGQTTVRRARGTTGGRPLVLVPGWSMNRSSLALLAARFGKDGRDAYPITYSSTCSDADRMAAEIAAHIERIARASGAERVDVLAHSQGGVLVRAAARNHGVLGLLGNVVTLGSPHGGAALASLFNNPRLRHLRPGSRFLERLLEDDPLPSATTFTAIYSTFDAIVFPAECAYYPGVMNITIDGLGHHALLFSERVYRLAKENLDVESPGPRSVEHLDD
jgi:triacylglycerol esterase/lipase EstA (alpha/beta hydrolase family)